MLRFYTKANAAYAIPLALLLLNPGIAKAAVLQVSNCNDSGPGSLRSRVAAAASGDTIDLAHLACGRITLTSGQIEIPQDNLTLVGRSRDALTLDGNLRDRVLWHRGTGVFRLEHLSVANGFRTRADATEGDEEVGGCIRSEGDLDLDRTRVHDCTVFLGGFLEFSTRGGGVSAARHVNASYTAIYDNEAADNGTGGGIDAIWVNLDHSQVNTNKAVAGGGVYSSGGGATIVYSTIQGNRASSAGGGILLWSGGLTIVKSTISGNAADNFTGRGTTGGGGIYARGGPNLIYDSTISGNRAYHGSVAMFLFSTALYNSTVAFNTVLRDEDTLYVRCEGALIAPSLRLESTIVARNPCAGGAPVDIGLMASPVAGSHNLVQYSLSAMPADTLIRDPRLGPLANNGGPTRTQMPASDSPVIDHGNNVQHHAYDQRGPEFPRIKGARPDVGAIER